MECKICGSKEIKGDCQYINGDYYHNHCIEQLQQENNQLKEQRQELRSWLEETIPNTMDTMKRFAFIDVLSKLNELEGGKNE